MSNPYRFEEARGVVEVHGASDDVQLRVCGAGGVVEIQKLYGPLALPELRIHADIDAGEWVIERSDDGLTWVEVARI